MSKQITTTKAKDFNEWYTQVITRSGLISYYDVSGCYVLFPYAYEIWENIQKKLDSEIKKRGVKNAYFPLFVTKTNLEREKNHIKGFAAEVAWIKKPIINADDKN